MNQSLLWIPVNPSVPDRWAWEPEKHGEFSVRSAYRLLMAQHMRGDSETPQSSGNVVWKKTWSLSIPPKVKVFWWRTLHEFLPAKTVLHHRHIEPTAFCKVCGADNESIRHVLIECSVAREFWRTIKCLTGTKLPDLHPIHWVADLLCPKVCSDKVRGLLIIGMYALWTERNNRWHGKAQTPVKVAVQWAVDLAHDLWRLAQEHKPVKVPKVQQKWRPPPVGWTKCNVDAAFNSDKGQGSTAAVLRMADGKFVAGCAKLYPDALDVLSMEAQACRDGMIFTRAMGALRLQIETDCEVLAKLWLNRCFQRSHVAPILEEMRDLSSNFTEFVLMFAPRTCNRIAHLLAKQVLGESRVDEWHEAPSCINNLLADDCNSDPT